MRRPTLLCVLTSAASALWGAGGYGLLLDDWHRGLVAWVGAIALTGFALAVRAESRVRDGVIRHLGDAVIASRRGVAAVTGPQPVLRAVRGR